MAHTFEFIKFVDGRAEPVVVKRSDEEFKSAGEAALHAKLAFATAQAALGAIAYRIVKDGTETVTTVLRGE